MLNYLTVIQFQLSSLRGNRYHFKDNFPIVVSLTIIKIWIVNITSTCTDIDKQNRLKITKNSKIWRPVKNIAYTKLILIHLSNFLWGRWGKNVNFLKELGKIIELLSPLCPNIQYLFKMAEGHLKFSHNNLCFQKEMFLKYIYTVNVYGKVVFDVSTINWWVTRVNRNLK